AECPRSEDRGVRFGLAGWPGSSKCGASLRTCSNQCAGGPPPAGPEFASRSAPGSGFGSSLLAKALSQVASVCPRCRNRLLLMTNQPHSSTFHSFEDNFHGFNGGPAAQSIEGRALVFGNPCSSQIPAQRFFSRFT